MDLTLYFSYRSSDYLCPKERRQALTIYRLSGLNKITVKNQAPLLLITKILDCLGIATIYTKLDLKDIYYWI